MRAMSALAERYGIVLFELGIPRKEIETVAEMLRQTPLFTALLADPTVPFKRKRGVIGRVLSEAGCGEKMQHFLMKLTEAGGSSEFDDVCLSWKAQGLRAANCLAAELFYVTEPSEEQKKGFEQFLARRFGAGRVVLTCIRRPQLLGGFILKAGDIEFDYSLSGQARRLRQAVRG